jgi:hypothetical protein
MSHFAAITLHRMWHINKKGDIPVKVRFRFLSFQVYQDASYRPEL